MQAQKFRGMSDSSDIFPGLTLTLGHAASGKSLWAEGFARESGAPLTYVATARLWDAETEAKARDHAARRGTDWRLVEAQTDLAGACAGLNGTVLIDCATMWLTNVMLDGGDWQAPAEAWLAAMAGARADFVVVSNDVGGGVTPDNALARRFQRAQGALNQQLAAAADRVVMVTAGLPMRLK